MNPTKNTAMTIRINDHVAKKPPSIGRVTPFTIAAFSLRRNRMQLTTSSTSANLPRGIFANMGPALAGSDHPTLPMAVIVTVGFTAFTRIFFGPSSRAATLMKMKVGGFYIFY